MTDNTPILLVAAAVIALIGLTIGAAIGYILAGMRASNPQDGDRAGADELAKLVRNRRSGKLNLELRGKTFSSASELNTAQRSELTQLLDEFNAWVGTGKGKEPDAPAPAVASTLRIPSAAAAAPSPPAAAKTERTNLPPVSRPVTPVTPPTSQIRPPSLQLGDILAQAINPKERDKEPPEGPQTIAGQVDAIIQARLPESPARGHSIQLLDGVGGGVVVWVDGKKFNGIGDVDDPEVRALIQSCVAEWEKKHT